MRRGAPADQTLFGMFRFVLFSYLTPYAPPSPPSSPLKITAPHNRELIRKVELGQVERRATR